jgi:deoxycytidylate deaminase
MFLAFTSSLRSADLSRQVGAVVVSAAGDVVAVGANDVPQARGGLYWPGPDDQRDHVKGEDFNERERTRIVEDTLCRLLPEGFTPEAWLARGRQLLSSSPLMDITEYGRAVHAEMEAILSCARSGVSPRGGTLYSTTFPCHNCAKHIVASGIRRVVYVEPYAKSRAAELFFDSITLDQQAGKVSFEPFEGVGPRKFFDLFSMTLSSGYKTKRKADGRKLQWFPNESFPRIPLLPNTYIDRERVAADELMALTSEPSEAENEENHS